MKFKSFKQKEDELKASRIHIDRVGQFTNEELYTINERKIKEQRESMKIKGQKHVSMLSTILFIIIHIIAIIGSLILKEYLMIVSLIFGIILIIVIKGKIKIELDSTIRERLGHFSLTLKSVFNYFPFMLNLAEVKDNLHKGYIIILLVLPFIMIWKVTYFIGIIYFIFSVFWFLTLVIEFYNKEYFVIEKRLATIMNVLMINIFVFGLTASGFYIVAISMYLIYLFLYKFIRCLTDFYKEQGGIYKDENY